MSARLIERNVDLDRSAPLAILALALGSSALLAILAQDGDFGDDVVDLVVKGALEGKDALVVGEVDFGDCLLVDGDTVVEVQLALGGLVLVEGHDELKVVLA